MREIEAAMARGDKRAQLAFEMFAYRIRFYIGAMVMSLGNLDTLVFTAGIGENSATLRSAICENLNFLGIKIDANKNSKNPADTDISTVDSRVKVLLITAREDWAIARECGNYLK
jgi:acetate kinase